MDRDSLSAIPGFSAEKPCLETSFHEETANKRQQRHSLTCFAPNPARSFAQKDIGIKFGLYLGIDCITRHGGTSLTTDAKKEVTIDLIADYVEGYCCNQSI